MSAVLRYLLLAIALVCGASFAAQAAAPPQTPATPPPLIGPKPTIAVGVIEATGGYGDTNWDVGNGLRSMLTKSLEDSGRFIVVERANLDQVLNEKQLQASRV